MKRNYKMIAFSIVFQVPILMVLLIASQDANDITLLIPGENAYIDILYFFVFSPIIMIVLIILLEVPMSIIFFKLHNIMKLKRFRYAILQNPHKELRFSTMMARVIIMGLFGFSIGTFLSQLIHRNIILSLSGSDLIVNTIATLFIIPFLIIIIAPIWLLQDSSIMCSQKSRKEGSRLLPDIEGVYKDIYSIVKGYVGISTLFAIGLLAIENFILDLNPSDWLLGLILMINMPFISIAVCIPAILFYESKVVKLSEALKKSLQKRGFKIIEDINNI
ncbi:MAG: hypothetical protein JXA99_06545 [Candidatus Lokiarchaeota archaeon]|nr:hypothetical protein [Candidatus Lokiarchaeota archaeon]